MNLCDMRHPAEMILIMINFVGIKMETLQDSAETWNLCRNQKAKRSTGKCTSHISLK